MMTTSTPLRSSSSINMFRWRNSSIRVLQFGPNLVVYFDHSMCYGSGTKKIWPEIEFSWRLVLATLIGFLGSAFGTVGGVGGGGIFVPMLPLIVGFDTKFVAALSKCMIMGASTSSVWYNLSASSNQRSAYIGGSLLISVLIFFWVKYDFSPPK